MLLLLVGMSRPKVHSLKAPLVSALLIYWSHPLKNRNVLRANDHLTKMLKITLIIDLPNGKTLVVLRHTTTFLFIAEKRNLTQKMNEILAK